MAIPRFTVTHQGECCVEDSLEHHEMSDIGSLPPLVPIDHLFLTWFALCLLPVDRETNKPKIDMKVVATCAQGSVCQEALSAPDGWCWHIVRRKAELNAETKGQVSTVDDDLRRIGTESEHVPSQSH